MHIYINIYICVTKSFPTKGRPEHCYYRVPIFFFSFPATPPVTFDGKLEFFTLHAAMLSLSLRIPAGRSFSCSYENLLFTWFRPLLVSFVPPPANRIPSKTKNNPFPFRRKPDGLFKSHKSTFHAYPRRVEVIKKKCERYMRKSGISMPVPGSNV